MRRLARQEDVGAEHHAVIHWNGSVPIYPHAIADVGLCLGRYSAVHGLAFESRQPVEGFIWLISSSTRPFVSTPTNQSAMAAMRYATAKV